MDDFTGVPTEYLKDTLERIRACGIMLACLFALWVWLIATLMHKGVIGWDDLALSHVRT